MSGKKPKAGKSKQSAGSAVSSSKKDISVNYKNTDGTSEGRGAGGSDEPSAGYLVSCDVPTKQFILYLNELKPVDKKFIIQDLDATHLLVEQKSRDEIERKVEEWLDENIFSAVEKVGEDFDMS